MKNNFILKTILIFLLIFLPINCVILIHDPGFLIKKFNSINYCSSKESLDRYIIPSVINKIPHDTVIVGDSLASELSTDVINTKFNTISINSCQRGSQLFEQKNVINYEIKRNKKLKRILWVIRNSLLTEEDPDSIYSKKHYPWYLYSNIFIKNIYYFDAYILNFCSEKDRSFTPADFNYYDMDFFNEKQNISSDIFFNAPKTVSFINSLDPINPAYQNNLEQNIIKTINQIPDNIEVIFVFPPVRMRYFYHYNCSQYLDCQNYIIEQLSQKSNVHFVDYTIENSISLKADYFFDHIHYSPEIGKFMVENIDNPKYHITRENKDSFNQVFLTQLNEFNKLTEEEIKNY